MGPLAPEIAYKRYLELRDELGLEALGLRTNQIWHDNPSELVVMLARYKFVAKLLSQRHDVAEYGCNDAFGTRIVLQEVKKVTVYDDDPIFIEDVLRRHRAAWPVESHVHDILKGRLPALHDSIYSLDAIQYISPDDERTFVRHLSDSLSRDFDILIIGTPVHEPGPPKPASPPASLQPGGRAGAAPMNVTGMPLVAKAPGAGGDLAEMALAPPQARGEPALQRANLDLDAALYSAVDEVTGARIQSLTGLHAGGMPRQIYRRTGAELKELMEQHFNAVFMFSLADEAVHPGLTVGAPYVLALCCSRKA